MAAVAAVDGLVFAVVGVHEPLQAPRVALGGYIEVIVSERRIAFRVSVGA